MEVTEDINSKCELVTDSEYWDETVLSNPFGSFFHCSSWLDSICSVYNLRSFKIILASSEGAAGYLPLVEIRSRIFGHRLVSTPFCEYGGVNILPGSRSPPVETAKSLHSFAESIRKQTGSALIEYRAEENRDFSPKDLDLEISASYVNFKLRGTSEEIWGKLDRKLRNIIRKSSQAGIQIRRATSKAEVSDFYHLYLKVQTKRGSPVHKEAFFQSLLESGKGEFTISLACLESQVISAIITTSLGGQVNWWMNVNDPFHRQKNATSLLLWDAIKENSERASNFSLNLGRTRTGSSIYEFKKQWAGEETTLLDLTDKKTRLSDPDDTRYRLASKLWSVLPLSLAKRIGPPVVVGIGL